MVLKTISCCADPLLNGHYYSYVSSPIKFWGAIEQASTLSYLGLSGHVATLGSITEFYFLVDLYGGNAWLGQTDESSEGTYRYVTGPEAGLAGLYLPWDSGEPNNCCGGEHYVHITGNQRVNDGGDVSLPYYVEYDCPQLTSLGAYGCTRTCVCLCACVCLCLYVCMSVCVYHQLFFSIHSVAVPVVPSYDGHFYAIISGSRSLTDAATQASRLSFNGMQGYLASITTPQEYNFVMWNLRPQNVWVDISDQATEGTWRLTAGPDAGKTTTFLPWFNNEPNGGRGENCVVLGCFGYIDSPCSTFDNFDFLVEFECASPAVVWRGGCIRTCDCRFD
jgi:hypothetical protein